MLNHARPPEQAHKAKFPVCCGMRKQLSVAEMSAVAFPKPLNTPFQYSPRKTQVIFTGKVETWPNVKRFSVLLPEI